MFEILRNMLRRKTRTSLTVFGITIGVFALAVMGAMAEYFNVMLDNAEQMGLSTVAIQPATRSTDDRLNTTTVQQLSRVDGVRDVVNVIGGMLADEDSAVNLGPPDQVLGIEPRVMRDFYPGVELQVGRWLDENDARAVVIGSKIASKKKLGVGSILTWRKNDYLVVGVMKETNTEPDGLAVMPFDTVRRDLKYPSNAIGSLSVVPVQGVDPEGLAARINQEVPRVKAKSPKQVLDEIRNSLSVFNAIMVGSALMAAVVGGLAVVNTMIMSVSERTREIGIKKAIGAESTTIVKEYLTEAALIGLIGGLAGLWAGWVVTTMLNTALGASLGAVWQLTPRLALTVVLFAVGLGTFAGLYPAWFAARLQPVQALRAE